MNLRERIEAAAGNADREAYGHQDRENMRLCEGQAHGLRAALRMIEESADEQTEKLLIEAREKLIAAGYNPEAIVDFAPRPNEVEYWTHIISGSLCAGAPAHRPPRLAALRLLCRLYLKITEP